MGEDNFEEFEIEEEKEQQVQTAEENAILGADSYFDGTMLGLFGNRFLALLIITFSLGIATPWANCLVLAYKYNHTVYNGKRLKFEGNGGTLFGKWIKWMFYRAMRLR